MFFVRSAKREGKGQKGEERRRNGAKILGNDVGTAQGRVRNGVCTLLALTDVRHSKECLQSSLGTPATCDILYAGEWDH